MNLCAEAFGSGAWALPPASLRSEDRPKRRVREPDRPARAPGLPGFPRRRVPRPVDVRAEWVRRQAPEIGRLCESLRAPVRKSVKFCGRIKLPDEFQAFPVIPSFMSDPVGTVVRYRILHLFGKGGLLFLEFQPFQFCGV